MKAVCNKITKYAELFSVDPIFEAIAAVYSVDILEGLN